MRSALYLPVQLMLTAGHREDKPGPPPDGIIRPTTPKEVKKRALAEVRALMQEFHFDPTLYRMKTK